MSQPAATAESLAARPEWTRARRIVVKIGSALLADRETGTLKTQWLASLMEDVAELVRQGKDVVLVSSGSIALGRHKLGLPKGPLELEQSQAAAAVGQISLAHAYQELAAKSGLTVAQILLTLGDTEQRRRYLNARHTIETLLELKAIPVVNENDTVATAEIKYGDNDRLSARVAGMVSADCLVLLSDIDGLYTAPPASDPTARHIPLVTEITAEIEAMAGDAGTELSKGGMKTKIEAGKIALGAGTNMVITTGKVLNPLRAISEGSRVSWFLAKQDPVTAKKRWIAGQLEPRGTLHVDAGAEKALAAGKSLLVAGVKRVDGEFERGDAVIIRAPDGRELGRGLSAYARGDAERILGRKSSEIADILGFEGGPELIHRNDMALNTRK
ncbi:MAG TPA: glutamate 5-kinase [Hyphomicrobium zavarzinii]|jgi:glutamate 5-kinase|uniref:glutamate 5-kinase n=1 Tax=Hyphomicrobium sp. DMF-1 TaxID=3019544 RepID=UPI0022EBC6A2|nr:glutamate 5-kinase [Hyphomicrobium sp. DMF-1]WBT37601.1 glutamate 5-kinase [Hyphomicrobium sp. DMF-1]HML42069.1 glutamate 5-kinase [Hyphomicrobium zavarzinii]